MILVDSSVWIDYFRSGPPSLQAQFLNDLLRQEPIAIGDLILTEVLQGFQDERDFNLAQRLLCPLLVVRLGGKRIALQAAKNYRKLRALGFTPRKTIDTVIATWCIMNGAQLVHNDRDFDPFTKHLGLLTLTRDGSD